MVVIQRMCIWFLDSLTFEDGQEIYNAKPGTKVEGKTDICSSGETVAERTTADCYSFSPPIAKSFVACSCIFINVV